MAEKKITIAAFVDDLKKRIEENQTIDCCKEELLRLADIAKEKLGNEKILVNWKD